MFVAVEIGRQPTTSVINRGKGADLFFGHGAISNTKFRVGGARSTQPRFLGYHVDLANGAITLPGPETSGVAELVNSPVFDQCCLTLGLQSLHRLRGFITHWAHTVRILWWPAEPINQMMKNVDANSVWIRRAEWWELTSFWPVIQFIRDFADDGQLLRNFPAGSSPALVGIQKELTFPPNSRDCIWFSGDATPPA